VVMTMMTGPIPSLSLCSLAQLSLRSLC